MVSQVIFAQPAVSSLTSAFQGKEANLELEVQISAYLTTALASSLLFCRSSFPILKMFHFIFTTVTLESQSCIVPVLTKGTDVFCWTLVMAVLAQKSVDVSCNHWNWTLPKPPAQTEPQPHQLRNHPVALPEVLLHIAGLVLVVLVPWADMKSFGDLRV